MTDVQVSNARRIGFTALALVAFWVLAWHAYGMGFEDGMPATGSRQWNTITQTRMEFLRLTGYLRDNASICFAIPPAILLSLAVYNWPWDPLLRRHVDHRRWLMLIAIVLFPVTNEVCYRLGESDAGATQEVSWHWLLLPIILTTAFVIFGAWRRAVWDAEDDVVGEDE